MTKSTEKMRYIECHKCNNSEEFSADEQRWHSQNFAWVQNLDDGILAGEAIYKCLYCGKFVISEIGPKEE